MLKFIKIIVILLAYNDINLFGSNVNYYTFIVFNIALRTNL